MKQADELLSAVLKICRAKSNRPLAEWSQLQEDIRRHLAGDANINTLIYRQINIDVSEMTKYKRKIDVLNATLKRRDEQLKKREDIIKDYRQRMKVIIKAIGVGKYRT